MLNSVEHLAQREGFFAEMIIAVFVTPNEVKSLTSALRFFALGLE